MAQNAKKVNYYRLALRRGQCKKMILTEDDRLEGQGGGTFSFLAPVFDAGEFDESWHRFRIEGDFADCKYEVFVMATNLDLTEYLNAPERTDREIIEQFSLHSNIRQAGNSDFLLHDLQGRYLWILIRVSAAKLDSHFRIEGFSVEFPAGSFIEYLPEIYQEERGGFFERYMAVLQSLYEDLETEVGKIPTYLDIDSAPIENLPLFEEWTGNWNASKCFNEEQMRFVLHNLQEFQSGKGTQRVLRQVVNLLTGEPAMVVEYFKWHDWMKGRSSVLETYEKLFGENEDMFTIIIRDMDGKLGTRREYVRKLLSEYVPLGMTCNLVWLEWSSNMDMHCYLDNNSRLAAPVVATTESVMLGKQVTLA